MISEMRALEKQLHINRVMTTLSKLKIKDKIAGIVRKP